MQSRTPKDWLVRTRAGDLLGPFTQRELVEELAKQRFGPDDEIAPTAGRWISAEALSYHDNDEFTQTSTRTHHTDTHSITTDLPGTHHLTPTPEARVHLKPEHLAQGEIEIPAHLLPAPAVQRSGWYLSVGVVVTLILVGIGLKLSRPQSVDSKQGGAAMNSAHLEGESPFVRQVYGLIQAGKTQTALRQLVLYHERGPAKNDVEYLIPYAALLILDGESPSRARKFLDQVLHSEASANLKSKAHLWLGYLGLMTEKPEAAESHFLEALQLSPKDPAARFNLGRTYLKQEKYSLALDYLSLAELESPDLWLIQIYKGRAKFALGQKNEARLAFRSAMDSSSDRWITYIYYALFLAQTEAISEAQKVMRTMLTRDPHYELHSPPPFGYYQEKLNYTEYLTAFSHVMETGLAEEKELGKRFINYLMTNQDEGHRIMTHAEKGGLAAQVYGLKIVLDQESSAADIQQALKRLPANLDGFGYYAYVLRGEALGRLGLFDEARRDFTRSIELSPRSAVNHWAFAALLNKIQETDEAQKHIREVLRYHPQYIPAIVWTQNL